MVLGPFAVVDQDDRCEADAVDAEEAIVDHHLDRLLIAAAVEVEVVDVAGAQHLLFLDAVLLHAPPADLDLDLLELSLLRHMKFQIATNVLGWPWPFSASSIRRPPIRLFIVGPVPPSCSSAASRTGWPRCRCPRRLRLAHVLIERDDIAAELEAGFPQMIDEVIGQVARLGHEGVLLVRSMAQQRASRFLVVREASCLLVRARCAQVLKLCDKFRCRILVQVGAVAYGGT